MLYIDGSLRQEVITRTIQNLLIRTSLSKDLAKVPGQGHLVDMTHIPIQGTLRERRWHKCIVVVIILTHGCSHTSAIHPEGQRSGGHDVAVSKTENGSNDLETGFLHLCRGQDVLIIYDILIDNCFPTQTEYVAREAGEQASMDRGEHGDHNENARFV